MRAGGAHRGRRGRRLRDPQRRHPVGVPVRERDDEVIDELLAVGQRRASPSLVPVLVRARHPALTTDALFRDV